MTNANLAQASQHEAEELLNKIAVDVRDHGGVKDGVLVERLMRFLGGVADDPSPTQPSSDGYQQPHAPLKQARHTSASDKC